MSDFGRLTFTYREPPGGMRRQYCWGGRGKSLRLAMLVVAALGMHACKNASERAAELAQQAEVLAQSGDLAGAQRAVAEAIVLREDRPEYHQMAGMLALQRGDPVGAYRSFERALEFDATNRQALAYVANIGVQIGRINDAEDAADRLLTIEPDAMPALQAKGMILLARGRYEEAMTYGDRIVARNPSDEAGNIIKARALAHDGKAEDALALIDRALTANPESVALLSNKVNLYRYLRQPEPMLEPLERLASRKTANATVRLDHINLLYKTGRHDRARQAALAFLKAGTRDPADYQMLRLLWWQYDPAPFPDGAGRDTAGWADPLAIVQAVRYVLARGDLAAAKGLLASAPPNAQDLLASLKLRVLAESGGAEQAREQVEARLAQDAEDVDALLLKARFALEKRDFQSAIVAAQQAQTNDPLNPETYSVLAGVYRAEGNDGRAKQVFEDGFRKLPQNFQLVQAYTQYLHELGDRARIVSLARSFARALPSSEAAWSFFLAQCQQARDATCLRVAQSGLNDARTAYIVDDAPGTARDRSLFGRF